MRNSWKLLSSISLGLMLFSCESPLSNSTSQSTNKTDSTDVSIKDSIDVSKINIESVLWKNVAYDSRTFTFNPSNQNTFEPFNVLDSVLDTLYVYNESFYIAGNKAITTKYENASNKNHQSHLTDTFPFFDIDTFTVNKSEQFYEILSFNNGNVSFGYFENDTLSEFQLSYPDSYLITANKISLLDKEKDGDQASLIAERFKISQSGDTLTIFSEKLQKVSGNLPNSTLWQCSQKVDKYLKFEQTTN